MKNFNFKGFQFPKTDAEKVRANVEAVALVKELEKTQQQATAEQQAVLAKYVGWGGLANVFFDRYAGKFEEERTRLESLVTPTEYQAMQKKFFDCLLHGYSYCRADVGLSYQEWFQRWKYS